MTRDVLSISVSKVDVERLFSKKRDIINYRRNRLKRETIENVMLIKTWNDVESDKTSVKFWLSSSFNRNSQISELSQDRVIVFDSLSNKKSDETYFNNSFSDNEFEDEDKNELLFNFSLESL